MLSSKVPKQHKSLAYALLQIPNAIPSLEEIKKPQEGNEATGHGSCKASCGKARNRPTRMKELNPIAAW